MSYGVSSPWLKSPLTDLTASLTDHQWYGPCADLEMKVLDCMEAYGIERGLQKCTHLIDDFNECFMKKKQMNRMMAMKEERERQYKAGERTKDNRYAEPPPVDSY